MAGTYFHPGVYIEEIPSGSKPIEGVPTSNAVFAGYTDKGGIGEPSLIFKWDDYLGAYGGIRSETDELGLAVNAFYLNGGGAAYIARLAANTVTSSLPAATMKGRAGGTAAAVNVLAISASSPGKWGDAIYVKATTGTDGVQFKLEAGSMVDGKFAPEEVFDGLTMNPKDPGYVVTVLGSNSKLIRADLSADLKGAPDDYFLHGTSVGGDISGFDWTKVTEGMTLTLNVDGLGARTITVGPPPAGGYDTAEKVRDELASRIAALGVDAAYQNFTVTFASNKLTLTSGTQGGSSSVVVRPGTLATLLKLGVGAGGTETHGSHDVVPATMADASALSGGSDGDRPGLAEYQAFFAKLRKIRDANIIVLPGQFLPKDGSGNVVIDAAIAHCEEIKNRMVIIDPQQGCEMDQASVASTMINTTSTYAALYYPWSKVRNPFYDVDKNSTAPKTLNVAPSAIAAGVWARIDGTRGVWKAPAGVETSLRGLVSLEFTVDDNDQDQLNPLGVNCLRRFPNYGTVVWGTRTLSTKANPEWRYVPVRRTAIFIEESIYNGIQWAVFEPNDHRLWGSLRANIGGFMNGLFRAGAFQGEKASDAYFVRCALGDTMTQDDIDRGQVIVIVGFAPLKPAEFVIVRIQQKVAQQ